MYDLELEGTPHFFAEGVLVHNSTSIKSAKAERTKFVIRQISFRATYRRILSGLPNPRSPLDMFSQMYFLHPEILDFKNYYDFRDHYAVMKKIRPGVRIVVGFRNVEEMQKKIEPHMFRVLLSECTDLPTATYTVRDVPMTKLQERMYAEMKKFATTQLSKEVHVTAHMVITQMLRLQQILLGRAVDEEGVIHEIPEHRTETLVDLLNETSEKVVVFCSYDADVRKVVDALEKEFGPGTVARFWGGNRPTREDEEKRFKTDPACRFMVATAAAGGRGRNWDCATVVVFYSSTNDLEFRVQGESRPLAVGKTQPILYVDLIGGPVERQILKALRGKIDLASKITQDSWREWVV